MKLAIMMAPLFALAMTAPASAGPDRFEQGSGCSMSSTPCAEQHLTNGGGKPGGGTNSGKASQPAAASPGNGLGAASSIGAAASQTGHAIGTVVDHAVAGSLQG